MKILKTVFLSCCSLLFAANSFALQVGDKAPEFTAISTAGEISLTDLLKKGPVVLAFYYADFTPV